MYYRYVLLLLFMPLYGMSISKRSRSESDINQISAWIHESDSESQSMTARSKITIIDNEDYISYVDQKSKMVHKFLELHARDGTIYRKCIEKELSEFGSSSSDMHRPRSLSQTKFDELLGVLGKAANKLEVKTEKQKKNNKRLKIATLVGTCGGAFCASLFTGIIVSVITYISATM